MEDASREPSEAAVRAREAEYLLAVRLYRTGDFAAAADLFAAISRAVDHSRRRDAKVWLVRMIDEGCVSRVVLDAIVAAHDDGQGSCLGEEQIERRALFELATARGLYEQGDTRAARRFFATLTAHARFGAIARGCIARIDER
jgi:hypothetical protein